MSRTGTLSDQPVLVLTNERDFAADAVITRIHRLGRDVERLNAETFGRVSWRPDVAPMSSGASAVWLRQFLKEPQVTSVVADVDNFLVTREQWRAWLTDLAEHSGPRWMNPLWASRRAENKLVQLRTALGVGLPTPPTLVTNSRDEAAAHQAEVGPCIVKSVAAAYFAFSTSAFMFTQTLDEALAHDAHDWRAQPVIVQKRIVPRRDVRLFVIDRFAAAATAIVDQVDWRIDQAGATWYRCDVPVALTQRCRAYMRALGLVYGAFDFAVDGDSWWFLECNQAGEFAFADRPLDLGVGQAIAEWLCGEAR